VRHTCELGLGTCALCCVIVLFCFVLWTWAADCVVCVCVIQSCFVMVCVVLGEECVECARCM